MVILNALMRCHRLSDSLCPPRHAGPSPGLQPGSPTCTGVARGAVEARVSEANQQTTRWNIELHHYLYLPAVTMVLLPLTAVPAMIGLCKNGLAGGFGGKHPAG